MENTEVRIGNYISEARNIAPEAKINSPHQVCMGDFEYGFEDHDGIPITKEWLTKNKIEIGEYSDESTGADFTFIYTPFHEIRFSKIEIKHIHQLQNIYFAITGEELQIVN